MKIDRFDPPRGPSRQWLEDLRMLETSRSRARRFHAFLAGFLAGLVMASLAGLVLRLI